jgi:hypothetical protein
MYMKTSKIYHFLVMAALFSGSAMTSCSDDEDVNTENANGNKETALLSDDDSYVGKAVGNFTAEEWFVGGEKGTTMNVTQGCYEDETPAVTEMGLTEAFNRGEQFFERNVTEFQTPFNGLGPAYVRKSCLDCHPGYGHGKRVTQYRAEWGNGYLLVIYHPADGLNSDDGPYVSEVTGMPQTRAVSPFLPPVDESGIHISWLPVTAMADGSEISATQFPDGEQYELIYPEVSIDREAFNTNPTPWETGNGAVAFRLESTIGIIGSGLLDAIPDDSIRLQYRHEAPYVELNPAFWDKEADDFAASAWYVNASSGTEQVNRLKKFTYAMTRGSLQDGAGANAIWNITNVSRSDRPKLYTTAAWAKAMSENPKVMAAIRRDPTSPYYADGTDEAYARRSTTCCCPPPISSTTSGITSSPRCRTTTSGPSRCGTVAWQFPVPATCRIPRCSVASRCLMRLAVRPVTVHRGRPPRMTTGVRRSSPRRVVSCLNIRTRPSGLIPT